MHHIEFIIRKVSIATVVEAGSGRVVRMAPSQARNLVKEGRIAQYGTRPGWILQLIGMAEDGERRYLDREERAGVLASLDELSERGFRIIHVSEERTVSHAQGAGGETITSTEVVATTYLLRRDVESAGRS